MKVVTVVGARPQFIKAAPLSRALRAKAGVTEILVHTGQHYDTNMSDIFFEELSLPKPDYHLGVGSMPHGAQTGLMLKAIEEVLLEHRPDWVLVYGDTNSTIAASLAAVKLHIPVAHVEAGLRSYNRKMPEEINRVVSDHVSTLLFAPTEAAIANLRKEGLPADRVVRTGDIMMDAALYYAERAEERSKVLEQFSVKKGGYVLATIHRAENTDVPARLKSILTALNEVAREFPIVLPLHPRTKSLFPKMELSPQFKIVEPVGYLDMVRLERNAAAIVTDSGGVQKEAFFHGVPCVTLRDETEWVELVELGWNRLVDVTHAATVTATVFSAIGNQGKPGTPYGHGNAAEEIVAALLKHQGKSV